MMADDQRLAKRRFVQVGLGVVLSAAALAPLVAVGVEGSGVQERLSRRAVDRAVTALLTGIPQQGDALGRATAPVTLRVYTDLECLTARNWWMELLPEIIARFVRGGEMRVEFLSFKTDTRDPTMFVDQQVAALAAGAQGRMWNFVETFYYEQGKEYTPYATERYIDGIAGQVPGLQLARWHGDRQVPNLAERVVAEDKEVRALGFHDTPAFTIGRTGGPMRKLTGRHIVLQFPGSAPMVYPVSLIDIDDLRNAIKSLHG